MTPLEGILAGSRDTFGAVCYNLQSPYGAHFHFPCVIIFYKIMHFDIMMLCHRCYLSFHFF